MRVQAIFFVFFFAFFFIAHICPVKDDRGIVGAEPCLGQFR
jgi:hypothetical protein